MHLKQTLLTVPALLALAGTAFSGDLFLDYSADLTTNSLGGLGSGQTFYPEDAACYSGQATLDLTAISFWSGHQGGAGDATTYLAIYDGDPDTSTLVGTSTNSIDTSAAVADYTEWTWTFASLTLNPSTEYWAVLSNSPSDINPANEVGRSLQEYDHTDAYRGSSIIANRSAHGSSFDLRFKTIFDGGPGSGCCDLDYSDDLTLNSLGGLGAGQTFFPEDADCFVSQSSMDLTSISFWSGSLGGAGHATTYLAIYDGDPDVSTLVGSSTNSIDTAAAVADYTEWTWNFASLSLNPSTEYWAVLSNSPSDVNPTNEVGRSLQEYNHTDAYRGTSIIANRSPHGSSFDLRFKATFANGSSAITSYCFGDGSGTTCPCGNVGASNEGCANSTAVGAILSASGTASVVADDLVLNGSQLPPGVPSLFFQGTIQVNAGAGSMFGDGLLCAGGSIQRMQIVTVDGSGNASTTVAIASTFGGVVGATNTLQLWYRDPSGPCSGQFNTTNALSIDWK